MERFYNNFEFLPKDTQQTVLAFILSKPANIDYFNRYCKNNNKNNNDENNKNNNNIDKYICNNYDLWEALWLKFIFSEIPRHKNGDKYSLTELKNYYNQAIRLYEYPCDNEIKYKKDVLYKKGKFNVIEKNRKAICVLIDKILAKTFLPDEEISKDIVNINQKNSDGYNPITATKSYFLLQRIGQHNYQYIMNDENIKNLDLILNRLIERGADINSIIIQNNVKGNMLTNIHNYKIIELYMKHGININYYYNKNNQNNDQNIYSRNNDKSIPTLLYYIVDNEDNYNDVQYEIERYDIVKLLLDNGADINIPNYDNGRTPIIAAAISYNKKNIIELLLEYEPDLNILDNNGKGVLTYSTDKNSFIEYIDYGADVNAINNDKNKNINENISENYKNTLLIQQVKESVWGSFSREALMRVPWLLKYGADPNIQNYHGNVALSYVRTPYLLNKLLKYRADISIPNNNGDTPFFKLFDEDNFNAHTNLKIDDNFIQMIDIYLSHYKNKLQDKIQSNIKYDKMNVSKNNMIKRKKKERKNNAKYKFIDSLDINYQNKEGTTIFMHAMKNYTHRFEKNYDIMLAEKLITKGADVNIRDNKGRIAAMLLPYAATNIIKLLFPTKEKLEEMKKIYSNAELKRRISNINAQDNEGNSVLMHLSHAFENILIYMIENGADPNIENNLGQNILDKVQNDKKILIIKNGLDVNHIDKNGLSYLMKNLYNKQITKILIEQGANINYQNNQGQNILHLCCEKDPYGPNIEFLLKNGAKSIINVQDNDGNTPLLLFLKSEKSSLFGQNFSNYVDNFQSLINHGADINIKNYDDVSSLDLALSNPKVSHLLSTSH